MIERRCLSCDALLAEADLACPSCGAGTDALQSSDAAAGAAFGSPIDSSEDNSSEDNASEDNSSEDEAPETRDREHQSTAPDKRGPICPIHDGPANGTCKRCGTFMCELCRKREGQQLCPSCAAARNPQPKFPLRYEDATFIDMWRHGSEAFRKQWMSLTLAALLALTLPIGVLFGFAMGAGCLFVVPLTMLRGNGPPSDTIMAGVLGLYLLAYVFAGLVGVALQFRLAAMALRAARGQSAPVMLLFQDFGKGLRAGPMVFVAFGIPYLLIAAFSVGISEEIFVRHEQPMFFSLLFLCGMLLYLPQVIYTLHELTENRRVGSFGSLITAHEVVRGDRGRTLGGCAFMGLLIAIGSVIFCLGAMPALALAHCVFATFYLTLRQKRGSDSTHRET